MAEFTLVAPGKSRADGVGAELLSLAVGVAATAGLFLAIAQFKGAPAAAPASEIADLRAMSMPPEPPPKVVTPPTTAEFALPFAGLEVAASDSPVKIAVLPPDLARLLPTDRIPPSAVIQATQFITDLKPRMAISADFQRVYQTSEVDQRVAVLSRPDPLWPRGLNRDIHSLRVTFLLVVNTNGTAENLRLLKSSGVEDFDRNVEAQVRDEWVFSPALKNGRKVRCLVQQSILVSSSPGSPFHI